MMAPLRSALAVSLFSLFSSGGVARAQVSFDPPTSLNPAPNVLLILDAARTSQINGSTCRGLCHAENVCGGEWDCTIYARGETRLQLARRALTGGYGWNTNVVGPDGRTADAALRDDGIMDLYRVRWGVAWYDGLGTRLAIDPSDNNLAAQRAVIDFAQPPNDNMGAAGDPRLNSFVMYPRTLACCGNELTTYPWNPAEEWRLPWFNEAAGSPSRVGRALKWAEDYWRPGTPALPFAPGPVAADPAYARWFSPGPSPQDETVIDNDVANVLVSGNNGCRRNYTILLSDENGAGNYNGESVGQIASNIYNLGGLPADKAGQVFHIHFGVERPFTGVADSGYDGVANNIPPEPYQAAPGGELTLPPLVAAFGAIFSTILSGEYNGAPATVSRFGDKAARSRFRIINCAANPARCNLGRPAELEWAPLAANGVLGAPEWDAADILRARASSDRFLYTGLYAGHGNAPTDTNCGLAASCADKSAGVAPLNDANLSPMYGGPSGVTADVVRFVRGDPTATFVNGSYRGDTNGDNTIDDPYKLMDTLNSRPVIAGAPPGIGEDLERWSRFRMSNIRRSSGQAGGLDSLTTVARRDQVLYIGANDGFLHAFLVGRAKATPDAGTGATYEPFAACPSAQPPTGELGISPAECSGKELWAYSPKLLHPTWHSLRSGHTYMVDGTPVVEDVLFTKGSADRGTPCSYSTDGPPPTCGANDWEYRTVLVQCLAGGGPGCFALDVTNPWAPALLWERSFANVPGKFTSSSLPTIARMKRTVMSGGVPVEIPYEVALMGGGYLEATPAGQPKGTFIAVGIEDGAVFTSPAEADADFASGPTCFDADNDSYVDTCYLVTTQASIYKIRMENGDPSQMTMVKFFDGRDASASGSATIRAFTKVLATPTTDNKIALFFATGDIEDVPDADEVNFLFKVRDLDPFNDMTPWDGRIGGQLANQARQADVCAAGSPVMSGAMTAVAPGSFQLPQGEKVLFDPVLVSKTVVFTTYRPERNPCILGRGFLYGIQYDTCEEGLDTNQDPNRTPDSARVDLDQGVPSGAAASYPNGNLIVTNSDTSIIDTTASRPPSPVINRLYKLRWRRGL